jgi:hypothetical protein
MPRATKKDGYEKELKRTFGEVIEGLGLVDLQRK